MGYGSVGQARPYYPGLIIQLQLANLFFCVSFCGSRARIRGYLLFLIVRKKGSGEIGFVYNSSGRDLFCRVDGVRSTNIFFPRSTIS